MELLLIVSNEESRRARGALPAQNEETTRDGVAAERRRQPEWSRPHDAYGVQR
jgi:predicted dithiol-disulfide oxidoreductase (DUF899 family)